MGLKQLRARIAAHDGDDELLVSLEEFFADNEDLASIGCNLSEHPGVERFYQVLRGVRERPEVDDVLVRITDPMDGDEWPFSDTVYVVGKAAAAEVQTWTAELSPEPVEPGELPSGEPALVVWWD